MAARYRGKATSYFPSHAGGRPVSASAKAAGLVAAHKHAADIGRINADLMKSARGLNLLLCYRSPREYLTRNRRGFAPLHRGKSSHRKSPEPFDLHRHSEEPEAAIRQGPQVAEMLRDGDSSA